MTARGGREADHESRPIRRPSCLRSGGGDDRIRTGDGGFADPCLAAWLRRLGWMVPRRGFEPLRPKARPPQDRVSANSTTSACWRLDYGNWEAEGHPASGVQHLASNSGRSGGTRTPDLPFWRRLLFQLSYTPPANEYSNALRRGSTGSTFEARNCTFGDIFRLLPPHSFGPPAGALASPPGPCVTLGHHPSLDP
jgi:hypothetical protein